MTNALRIGQRVTLLKIDDALALTHRYEMEVREVLTPEAVGYQKTKTRLAVIRQRGKRKAFYPDIDTHHAVVNRMKPATGAAESRELPKSA